MKQRNYCLRLLAGAALLALIPARPALADVWNKKTEVRFSHPVELPGQVVLPSGEYVMKLMDSQSQRHIVQVFNKEQSHVYATILAIPTEREKPAERTILTFYETPASQPMFIRHWYYPGDTIGQEFVYSKDRAKYIASLSGTASPGRDGRQALQARPSPEAVAMNQQEPAVASEPEAAQSDAPAPAVTATDSVDDADAAAAVPAEPAAEPVDAEAAPEDQAQEAEVSSGAAGQSTPRETLPATASLGGAVGLVGAGLLAASGLVRGARQRKS
ncbi:MAG: hypothetical protein JST93_18445 [Acidobacteria bacterium]|nr:hypothetical protein [Acidobacteriota bacterium]